MGHLHAAIALAAVTLSACAGVPAPAGDAAAPAQTLESIAEPSRVPLGPALPPEGRNPLPRIDVLEVGSGETVSLGTLLPAQRPLLVWFWAPH